MKKFVFSLQKILDLRNFELDAAEVELGKINSQIAQVNMQLHAIASQRLKVSNATDSSGDFYLASQAQAYFMLLDQKKEQFLNELARLEVIAEEKRDIVRDAMKKVKALEKIREHKKEEWEKDVLHEEEVILDDVVTARSYRTE